MYKDSQHWIKTLEEKGELIRIKTMVSPHLEISEITDRISKHNGPALLFESTGTNFPLLINSMGTAKRMALALGANSLDDIGTEIESLIKQLTSPKESILDKLKLLPTLGAMAGWMPKVRKSKGACQEVVMENPDLNKLPILKCWPQDGGPFLTLPVIHTKDPNTGIRNVGLYRMQVFNSTMTGMHWHRHKVSARHFNEYKKLNKKMPVAVAIGGDPVYSYAATAPLPDNVDEYMLAGFLRKKKVELVKCLTQDIEVPSDADIIIEGYVDPNEELILEGPFGDHTGYYSLPDYYPRFHVTAITHNKNAVYCATIVGIPPQEDAWIGKATERIFLVPIKMTMVPEIVDMVMPVEGVFHNLVIVKIKKDYPGQALKVMNSLWGAGQMMFTKMLIVVDDNVNIHDNVEVAQYISQNTDVSRDIILSAGPVDVLDHSCSVMAFGGKLGIDATKKLPEEIFSSSENETTSLPSKDFNEVLQSFPEIKAINSKLIDKNISLIFISIEKNRKGHIKELAGKIFKLNCMKNIKVAIFLEHTLDIQETSDAVWRFANNFDPKRDTFHISSEDDTNNHIALDGTRKTKEFDNFTRDWPNILVSDNATIEKVDAMWSQLGLGDFISSPSLKYKSQLYGNAAVAE